MRRLLLNGLINLAVRRHFLFDHLGRQGLVFDGQWLLSDRLSSRLRRRCCRLSLWFGRSFNTEPVRLSFPPDLGALEVGRRADLVAWPVDGPAFAGAVDPVAALVLSGPHRPRSVWVEGRELVRDGALTTLDLAQHLKRHNTLAKALVA